MTSLDRIIKIINKEAPYLDKLRNVLKNNKEFLDNYYDKELENLISNNPKLETETLAIPIDSLTIVIKGMILNDSKFQVFSNISRIWYPRIEYVYSSSSRRPPSVKNTYRLFFSWKSIYQRRRNICVQRYGYTWSQKYGS